MLLGAGSWKATLFDRGHRIRNVLNRLDFLRRFALVRESGARNLQIDCWFEGGYVARHATAGFIWRFDASKE